MTAEPSSSSSKRGVLLPILLVVGVGVLLRFTFVDLLTKTTGTWMGGVESPHREPGAPGSKGPSAA